MDGRAMEILVKLVKDKEFDRFYNKMDNLQKKYYESIQNNLVTFVDAPSGTGKTLIAVYAGLQEVVKGRKLIYIRFPSKRGERLGATPGQLEEKEYKYMYPFLEALQEMGLDISVIEMLREDGIIDMRTDVTERGRNIKNSFVIIDEAQNAVDYEQLQLILTRIHDSSKVVVIGHSKQTDSNVQKYGGLNSFQVYLKHMSKKSWTGVCELTNNYRGKISGWADEIEQTLKEVI